MLLYFVVMPRVYGFSTLGSVWALAALSVPFILATSFLGQALGLVFRHRETAVLLVLASSLPQFFLVGVSWPAEALPGLLRQARELLPSVNAIDGIVRVNQMGASLCRGAAGLAAAVGAHAALFRRRHGNIAASRGPRAESMPVPSRRTLLLGAVPVLLLVAIAAWYWWPSRAADACCCGRDGADHRDSHRPRDQRPAGALPGRAGTDGAARAAGGGVEQSGIVGGGRRGTGAGGQGAIGP